MINSVSNVGFTAGINANTNARQTMGNPYQAVAAQDTFSSQGEAKSIKGKVVMGTLGAVIVAAGALFGLNKAGILKTVENPTGMMQKLQNYAAKAGEIIGKGVSFVTDKAKGLIEKVKAMIGKSAPQANEAVKN